MEKTENMSTTGVLIILPCILKQGIQSEKVSHKYNEIYFLPGCFLEIRHSCLRRAG